METFTRLAISSPSVWQPRIFTSCDAFRGCKTLQELRGRLPDGLHRLARADEDGRDVDLKEKSPDND